MRAGESEHWGTVVMVVLYILVIAVVNLLLGYWTAVYVGYSPHKPGPRAISMRPAGDAPDAPVESSATDQSPGADEPPAKVVGVASTEAPPEVQPEEPNSSTDLDQVVDESICAFKSELEHYRQQLGQLDGRVRAGAEGAPADSLRQCIDELKETNHRYLERQSEHAKRLNVQSVLHEGIAHAADDVSRMLDEQAGRIEAVSGQLERMDASGGEPDGFRHVLEQTGELTVANDAFGASLEKISSASGKESTERDEGPALKSPAGLVDRDQFESALERWWSDDPARERPLTLGVVDVDRTSQLVETYGQQVTDRILDAVARVVSGEVRGGNTVSRMDSQRFVVMFPDTLPHDSTSVVEQIRQTVQEIQFEYQQAQLGVTVSCAVVEASPMDTTATLLERGDSTLQEAKRYGRNRTFLHEGKYPAPVIPPHVTVTKKVMPL